MTSRLSRHGIACALAWLLCAGLYFGTANGVAVHYHDRNNAWHHYEYLVEGFLAGHTYLSLAPSPELVALPDPYNPQANEAYRLWDASLYHGKYYLYYGPAPALLTMLPWKILTGHHLPQWQAVAAFAIFGLAALAALLAGVRKKYFPAAKPAHLFLAILLVAHVSWLPVILRRPAFWELPIVAAAALFWWSLFFLWKSLTTRSVVGWSFAGGLVLVLAIAARPSYVPAAAVLALGFLLPAIMRAPARPALRPLAAVALPLVLGGLALLAYNYARFGNVREFGNTFQLWGVDERRVAHFNPAHLWFNFRLYFFSLPELSPYFPFFCTVPLDSLPPGYIGVEEMPGLLFTVPALLLGFAAFRSRREKTPAALRVLLLTATGASLVSGALLFCFAGACSRYIVELSAGWALVVGIGSLAFFSTTHSAPPARTLRVVAGLAIAWTLTAVWLASFEFRSYARITQPWLYRPIARLFDYPAALLTATDRHAFGPVVLEIRLAPVFTPGDTVLLSSGRKDMRNALILERLAPARIRFRLSANDSVMIATPVFATTGSLIRIELHTPWLYPPTAHPYWNRFTDSVQRRRLQTVSVLATDVGTFMHPLTTFFDSTSFEPRVRAADDPVRGGAWVENWRRLDPNRSVAGRDLGVDQPELRPEDNYFPH